MTARCVESVAMSLLCAVGIILTQWIVLYKGLYSEQSRITLNQLYECQLLT